MRTRALDAQYTAATRLHVRPTAKGLAWLGLLALSAAAWGLIGWVGLTILG